MNTDISICPARVHARALLVFGGNLPNGIELRANGIPCGECRARTFVIAGLDPATHAPLPQAEKPHEPVGRQ
jgi:hypothetical protein